MPCTHDHEHIRTLTTRAQKQLVSDCILSLFAKPSLLPPLTHLMSRYYVGELELKRKRKASTQS